MFRRAPLLALVAALASAPPVLAQEPLLELVPSISISQAYDSHVLTSDDAKGDGDYLTLIAPELSLRSRGDWGYGQLGLSLVSRTYLDNSEMNGIDRRGLFDLDGRLAPRLSMFSSGSYVFRDDTNEIEEGGATLHQAQGDREIFDLAGGLRYALDARSSLSARLGFAGRRPDPEPAQERLSSQRDIDTQFASLVYSRVVTPLDRLDLTLGAAESDFGDIGAGEEESRTLSANLGWYRAWTPHWSTSAVAGIRRITSERERDPRGESSTSDFVGSLVLERNGRRTTASLVYTRQTQPSSSFGTSVDLDSLTALFSVKLSRRLTLRLEGRADLYGSIQEDARVDFGNPGETTLVFRDGRLVLVCTRQGDVLAPGPTGLGCFGVTDSEIDTTTLMLSARLNYRVTPDLVGFLDYRYTDQDSSGDIRLIDLDEHRILLGVRYSYPIDLR